MPYVDIINYSLQTGQKSHRYHTFITGEQLSEHQRKRAIGEVRFANVNL